MSKKTLNAIQYILIGIIFYLLDRENTFLNDDLRYSINHFTGEPVNSIFDAMQSQIVDWHDTNGRFVIHTITQCFCGFIGSEIFWICNTLIFLLFLKGLVEYVRMHTRNDIHPLGILLISNALLVPVWSLTYLGHMSGAINYLWAGCAYLWFFIYYDKQRNNNESISVAKGLSIFFISLLIGCLQESFCIGIAGFFCIYYALHFKRLRGRVAWIISGFCIGAALCVLAPSNFSRASNGGGSTFDLYRFFMAFYGARCFTCATITFMLLLALKKWRSTAMDILRKHDIIVISSVINIAFAAVIAFTGKHQFTGIETYSILVIICLLYELHLIRKERILNTFSAIMLICLAFILWPQRYAVSSSYKAFLENAGKSKNGVVVAKDYMTEVTKPKDWLRANFVRAEEIYSFNKLWASRYLSYGKNDSLIVNVLPDEPSEITKICNAKHQRGANVYKADANYYVIRLSKDAENTVFTVTKRQNAFDSLRSKLAHKEPFTVSTIETKDMDFAEDSLYRYHILYDYPDFEIISVEQ